MGIKEEIRKLSYKIKYVPDDLIKKHNVCYLL
jgi:hypothetical protein